MKKLIILLVILSFQTFSSQKTSKAQSITVTPSISEAKEFIEKYYADFTTQYDFEGEYKMLSNTYQPKFSGSHFIMTYNSYDEANKKTFHTTKFDFKNVISMQSYGGETVEIRGNETETIIISLAIGFQTKEKMQTVKIDVEDADDITRTEIYKAFEKVWKFYRKK